MGPHHIKLYLFWIAEWVTKCQLTKPNLDDLELFHNHCHYYPQGFECFSKVSIDSNLDTLIDHLRIDKSHRVLIHLVAYIFFQFVLNEFKINSQIIKKDIVSCTYKFTYFFFRWCFDFDNFWFFE